MRKKNRNTRIEGKSTKIRGLDVMQHDFVHETLPDNVGMIPSVDGE